MYTLQCNATSSHCAVHPPHSYGTVVTSCYIFVLFFAFGQSCQLVVLVANYFVFFAFGQSCQLVVTSC